MTTSTTTAPPVLGVLAQQEIRNYLRSKLFWVGALLLAAVTVLSFVNAAQGQPGNASSAMDMIAPSALLGVFGLIIMAGLTKRSDRAADAAGSVAVPERTRTAALAAAVVVPVTAALLWYAAAVATSSSTGRRRRRCRSVPSGTLTCSSSCSRSASCPPRAARSSASFSPAGCPAGA